MNTNTNRIRRPASRPRKTNLQQTEPVPEELRFIKRFVNLAGKHKKKEELLGFINALQKAIIEKKIRQSSLYADSIRLIQNRLVNFFNHSSARTSFDVDPADLKDLRPLVKDQKLLRVVRLIKQFISLRGRPGVKQEARLLLSKILKIYPELRIPHKDPYASELKSVIRSLKQFTGKDGGTILEISKAELNGLEAIAYDHEDEYEYEDELDGENEDEYRVAGLDERVTSSMELGEADLETLNLQDTWLELAAYLARNHGTVLYIHTAKAEADPAFQQKIQHVEIRHPKLYIAAGLPHDLSTYDFVFIDNINDLQLSAADLEALEETHPEQSFIYVSGKRYSTINLPNNIHSL
ncbi:hypothetical protein SAMN05444410_101104 [Hydrobacter penzbergensis]|uniref:Uncharacterized protein n=1 Tax=Hydrobacter penzbergensis TaxID=1235997 RepID=A0A8X8I8G3_9BACT|nr:hypothetical protein [Hydrobacter penzbergensis]SDW04662.1 hypothetical protein SAMN05444410_101104 [Hydrobacter penzbergensis]